MIVEASSGKFLSAKHFVVDMVVSNLLEREAQGKTYGFDVRESPSYNESLDALDRLARIPRTASAERAFAVAFGRLPSEEVRDVLNFTVLSHERLI